MYVSALKYTPYLTDALDEDLVSAKFYKKIAFSQNTYNCISFRIKFSGACT